IKLSLERAMPSRLLPSLLGLGGAERRRDTRAREFIAMMGLERYRDTQIRALSTGTRRIVELTCLVALEPRLLLLDEPSSGVAQLRRSLEDDLPAGADGAPRIRPLVVDGLAPGLELEFGVERHRTPVPDLQ